MVPLDTFAAATGDFLPLPGLTADSLEIFLVTELFFTTELDLGLALEVDPFLGLASTDFLPLLGVEDFLGLLWDVGLEVVDFG